MKSGDATVSPTKYVEKAERGHVFLLAQSSLTVSRENVSVIRPVDVLRFMRSNTGYLPDPVLTKLDAYL